MGSGHSLALGMQNDPYLATPSQADSLIDLLPGMEIGSPPVTGSLQQSLEHVSPEVSADTNVERRRLVEVEIMPEVACRPENFARMSDTPSAPVRDDSAVPDCVSKTIEQPQATESETEVMAPPYDNIRAAIRKDLQSGRFEIPPLIPVHSVDAPTQNLARYPFPPALMPTSSHSRHRRRFDRSALLPDSNLPFCAQVMEHVKDWAEWGTRIADEQRRKEVLDHVFKVLSNAWFEALRLGYNPGTTDNKSTAPQASTKRSAQRGAETPGNLPRGKPRSKRETSPSKMPFLVAGHRDGPAWAITAGELEEANISEDQVRRRAAAENTPEIGERLLHKVLKDYDGGIRPSDWHKIMPVTRLNPMGRDLMVYCLYEVLNVRNNIAKLWNYYSRFTTVRQKENTKRRIDEDQQRHDLFMALALELDEEKRSPGDVTPANPPTSCEGQVVVTPGTAEHEDQSSQLDVLIGLTEMILQGTDVASISSSFQLFEITPEDLVTGDSTEGLASSLDQCKHFLGRLLSDAREWLRLCENAEVAIGRDTDVCSHAQIRNLELKILEEKEILKNTLPSLIVKREATTKGVERSGASASAEDHSSASGTATAPTDDVLMAEVTSPVSSKHTVKHQLDEADEELPLPPAKRPKTGHGGENLNDVIPILNDGQVSRNIHGATAQNDKNGLDVSCSSHSDTASKETPRRCLVTLRVQSPFNPADFSSKRLFWHPQGFKYRYTNESTLAQRRSMAESLETYIQLSMETDKLDPRWRFGKYQALAHPGDPERTSIIHGIWDLENGDQPEGFEWFYRGDGTQPSECEEISSTQDEEVERVLPVPAQSKKKTLVLLKWKNTASSGPEASRSAANANGLATSSYSGDPSLGRPKKKNKKQNKDQRRHVRFGITQQAPVAHMDLDEPVSVNRPKRRIVVRRSYAEEEHDEDYCPSE
ncbi:uncharacterized protein Z520_00310 [Fonsecaea multimorphosa CBS 102226]|uniref:Uncharacterized protein n=1 Tax=Fonsecaea multimorphosa CBS 102226 TaxID=1442371 RepID=A0A0D2L3J7_9EURO|nr:uncharacterized protein Z520_00310 [Fonsecaea multimorphosa CBS 102226]KIY03619.1 hypothetical protein Z520_00310 [Fonsecaea multimorphosa CBS 102226]OAL32320.1 hypothetical protein AYO22_00342 [Fonsecaea multimorphosa]